MKRFKNGVGKIFRKKKSVSTQTDLAVVDGEKMNITSVQLGKIFPWTIFWSLIGSYGLSVVLIGWDIGILNYSIWIGRWPNEPADSWYQNLSRVSL